MISRTRLIPVLAVLLLAGCTTEPQETPKTDAKPPARDAAPGPQAVAHNTQAALISRELLFGNPERAGAELSPDGEHISWLAPVDGVLNVWVAPVDDLAAAEAVTHDTYRGIRAYFWAYTNNHIVYLQDKGGNENWHAFSVNLETGKETDLTPWKECAHRSHKSARSFLNLSS